MYLISPDEVPMLATSPCQGAANALGGFVIITRDCVEVTIMMVAKWPACSWRRLWVGGLNEIEGGNVAHACFQLLPPSRCCARTVFFPIPRFFAWENQEISIFNKSCLDDGKIFAQATKFNVVGYKSWVWWCASKEPKGLFGNSSSSKLLRIFAHKWCLGK